MTQLNPNVVNPSVAKPPVTVLYDGSNAAFAHEIAFLKSKNKTDVLEFFNIADAADKADEFGLSLDDVKNAIYARDASGSVAAGTNALYAAHAVIGLGPWFDMCRVPGFASTGTGIPPQQ